MIIKLKENWSEQFIFEDDDNPGYFTGRRKEIDSLKSILRNNNSSSILVSSVRGIGKSSFVHKAIKELSEENKGKEKELSEENKRKETVPFFINFESILSNNETNSQESKSKTFIKSLIIAAALSQKFKEDNDIQKLYKESLGDFSIEERNVEEKEDSILIKAQKETRKMVAGSVLATFLMFIGISLKTEPWNYILAGIGHLSNILIINWEHIIHKKTSLEKMSKQKNNFEYLELKFEEWLKSKKDDYILIFVIDELDKVNPSDALKIIQSLKNLFSRSFGHFIFIAGKKTYTLIETSDRRQEEYKDGEDDKSGNYPTLFTHRFYLPLPSSSDLFEYLKEIFEGEKNMTKEELSEIDNFKKYLLFRAGNDFFDLKTLLFDLIQNDDKNIPYLDTEMIRSSDINYDDICKLYLFVDNTINKFSRTLKKYWQQNSNQQESWFKFLNEKLNKDIPFKEVEDINKPLIEYLIRGGIIKASTKTLEDNSSIDIYIWTHQYPIESPTFLHDTEQTFLEKYQDIIAKARIFNALEEGLKAYSKDPISQQNDGSDVTGVSLHSLLLKYKPLKEKLKDLENNANVQLEESEQALEEINSVLENINNNYLDILGNIIDKRIKIENKQINLDTNNFNVHNVLSTIPNLLDTLKAYHTITYVSGFKYIFLIQNFDGYDEIKNNWQVIKNNTNLLFIDIFHGNLNSFKSYSFPDPKEFKNGKKKYVKRRIPNFKLAEISNYKDFEKIITYIEKFIAQS
ncbi:MAG: ATP-binding protein [Caldisericia bacterium]|nr:ATP-binding protein [Caldisericia bacterium]